MSDIDAILVSIFAVISIGVMVMFLGISFILSHLSNIEIELKKLNKNKNHG